MNEQSAERNVKELQSVDYESNHRKSQISRRNIVIILVVICLVLVTSMAVSLASRSGEEQSATVMAPASESLASALTRTSEIGSAASTDHYNGQTYGMAMGLQHQQDRVRNTPSGQGRVVGAKIDSFVSVLLEASKQTNIPVLLSQQQVIEHIPLEQYVLQVTLAELPNSFELEAIKAQMLAVRTYIVHRMLNPSNMKQQEISGEKYIVTDTEQHQVYWNNEQMVSFRADDRNQQTLEKFEEALIETKGEILVYKDEPIDAVFFSTSNGYTEAAEDYWGYKVDYLQSVESKWDQEISPSYEKDITFTFDEFFTLLGIPDKNASKLNISEVTRTDSKRITSININGQTYEGKKFRQLLGLASTDFTWKIEKKEKTITLTTYGYGHGVGMSQWGANGMARQGYLANEIVSHYYQGVHIEQASKLVINY